MKISVAAAAVLALQSVLTSAQAGSPVPYSYTFVGNAVNSGSGACSKTTGTFPATLTLTVDSATGNIDGYLLSFDISNAANGLAPQTILTEFFTDNPGFYVAFDPQLLGSSTALNGVSGSVVSGSFTTPNGGTIELGSGFGSSRPAPLVLSTPTPAGACGLSLTGILYARPN